MSDHEVLVIGGGQAGLAIGHHQIAGKLAATREVHLSIAAAVRPLPPAGSGGRASAPP